MIQKLNTKLFIRSAAFAAACVGAALPVIAGTQVGKVGYLLVRASDGLTYFTLEGSAISDAPACATNTYWMIRDENSEVGKKQYAMVLAAKASGRDLVVQGMNACNRWNDGEDVNSIQLR